MAKISYLIITYNGECHIKRCLDSIRNFDKEGFILVVDNASKDNTIGKINISSSSNKVIKLNKNIGFGKANNIGLKYLYEKGYDFFYLVNQDIYFESGNYINFLKTAEKYLRQDYAIISPIHLAPNGKDFDFKFKVYILPKNTRNLLCDLNKTKVKDIYKSKVVNAAAWILSRKAIKEIGFFNPMFNHYGEDSDYLNRVKYKKIKIGISPLFRVIHNRPQIEKLKNEDIKKSTSIWVLVYLNNINLSFAKLLIWFPFTLYLRLKNKNNKWHLYIFILFFAVKIIPKIIFSRKQSKQKKAFVNSIANYE